MPTEGHPQKNEFVENRILDDICEVLRKYNRMDTSINWETKLTSDLDIDSVGVMDVVMEIEDKFNIDIPVNLLADIETVGDLVGVVYSRTREK